MRILKRRLFSSVDSISFLNDFPQEYRLPPSATSHSVLVLQPVIRAVSLRKKLDLNDLPGNDSILNKMSKGPDEQEAYALVDSLDGWTVNELLTVNLRSNRPNALQFFTKGVWNTLTSTIEQYLKPPQNHRKIRNPATAVFVNWSKLRTNQLVEMQKAWNCPVFDRYSLVISLFLQRARTLEAKTQAQLAELGLVRSRLLALSSSVDSHIKSRNTDHIRQILNNQEKHLIEILKEEEERKSLGRARRRVKTSHQWPIVAVVGYTNSGKTSLIKKLSGSSSLHVSSQVFATLDITHHSARLPTPQLDLPNKGVVIPGLRLVFLDTIGFMADLPHELLSAFRATLSECLDSDLIIHLIDASKSDWQTRAIYVEQVLQKAGVDYIPSVDGDRDKKSALFTPISQRQKSDFENSHNQSVLLRIGNKSDIEKCCSDSGESVKNAELKLDAEISCITGDGLPKLFSLIEANLIEVFGWTKKKLRMGQGSHILQ